MIAPHGMELLGQGDYSSVTLDNVFDSSLAAYDIAGLSYTKEIAEDRVRDAIEKREGNPFSPSWEGIFQIPICDVSDVIYYDEMNDAEKRDVLTPYGDGHDPRPRWCGPICNWDKEKTNAFYKAANMEGWDHQWVLHCPNKKAIDMD